MADIRVADFLSLINRQIQAQEKIEACLWKLEALVTIAVTSDCFYDFSEHILHNYFSVAGDLIEEAAKINQSSLSELHKQSKTL
jgi:hypothetical protein